MGISHKESSSNIHSKNALERIRSHWHCQTLGDENGLTTAKIVSRKGKKEPAVANELYINICRDN